MRLLSWNIRWACGCDGRVDPARIAAVIRKMGDPEIVCLQEVAVNHPGLEGSAGDDQVAALQALLPGRTAHYAAASDLGAEDGSRRLFGNLILSRLPVLQVLRHSLPWPVEPGVAGMPRVAIEAIVATPSGTLAVTTTHLEYYSLAQRTAQPRRLRELHEEAHGHAAAAPPFEEPEPPFRNARRSRSAVLCGDFNCEPGAAELQGLLLPFADGAPRLKDAWTIAHPGVPHAATVGLHGCPWPDHAYCCDLFFVTEDLAGRVQGFEVEPLTDASDHQPIVLELA